MRARIAIIFSIVIMAALTGCAGSSGADYTQITQDVEQTGRDMKLRIDDTEIPVSWEKNASVSELKSLVENEPITIQMSMYGDFEQVGPIGQSITSNDKQITAKAGDIVLYSGDQIVIFYGTNSWNYTMLGHVEMAKDELTELLSNGDVKVEIE